MAMDSDMAHLLAAARALLHGCDRQSHSWLQQVVAALPAAFAEDDNALLAPYSALVQFDPRSALADRTDSVANTASADTARRQAHPPAATDNALSAFPANRPLASIAPPPTMRTTQEHPPAPAHPLNPVDAHWQGPRAPLATHPPRSMAKGSSAAAADSLRTRETTPPATGRWAASGLPSNVTVPPSADSRGRETAQASPATTPTLALATRRQTLARQRAQGGASRSDAQHTGHRRAGQAEPSTPYPIPMKAPGATDGQPDRPVSDDTPQRLAVDEYPGSVFSDGRPADDLMARRTPTSPKPPTTQQRQRPRDDTSAIAPPVSSESAAATHGATNPPTVGGHAAANSDDLATQLADAAYRHGIDLS